MVDQQSQNKGQLRNWTTMATISTYRISLSTRTIGDINQPVQRQLPREFQRFARHFLKN